MTLLATEETKVDVAGLLIGARGVEVAIDVVGVVRCTPSWTEAASTPLVDLRSGMSLMREEVAQEATDLWVPRPVAAALGFHASLQEIAKYCERAAVGTYRLPSHIRGLFVHIAEGDGICAAITTATHTRSRMAVVVLETGWGPVGGQAEDASV